jgi:hypothetical protein
MNLALPLHAPAWPRPAALPGPLRLAIGVSIGIHALALLVQGKGLPSVPEAPPAPWKSCCAWLPRSPPRSRPACHRPPPTRYRRRSPGSRPRPPCPARATLHPGDDPSGRTGT